MVKLYAELGSRGAANTAICMSKSSSADDVAAIESDRNTPTEYYISLRLS